MNENRIKNVAIDGLLTVYFQAQMPNPWPDWQAPEAPHALPRRRYRWLTISRFAVAASVGVLLATYLVLAGFFPREISGRLKNDPSRDIGRNPAPGINTLDTNR